MLYDFYFWWVLIWKECQEYSAKCVLLLLSLIKLKGRTLGIIYAPSNLLSHFLEVRSIINKSINLICVNPKVIYFLLSDVNAKIWLTHSKIFHLTLIMLLKSCVHLLPVSLLCCLRCMNHDPWAPSCSDPVERPLDYGPSPKDLVNHG